MYGSDGQAYDDRTAIPATSGPMQRARRQEKALDQPMRGRPAAKRALGIECRQHAKRHRKRSSDNVEYSTACVVTMMVVRESDVRGVIIARDAATIVCMEKIAKVGAQPRFGMGVTGGE